MPRNYERQARPPFWHRSRMGWANALGFALTVFLTLVLVFGFLSNLLPGSDKFGLSIPAGFFAVVALAHIAVVLMGAIVVLRFMMRGADFHTHLPRLYVFYWTCAGVLFYLCQMVTLVKYGMVRVPGLARFVEHVYWGSAPIGLIAFALMAYVNIDIPGDEEEHDYHEEEHWEYDEHEDWDREHGYHEGTADEYADY